MESLQQRKNAAKCELQEHCKGILEKYLTPEQLDEVKHMQGKAEMIRKVKKGTGDIVWRSNPLKIEAVRKVTNEH